MIQKNEYKIGDKLITSEEWEDEVFADYEEEIKESTKPIGEVYKIDKVGNYYLKDHITGEFMLVTYFIDSYRKATEEEITKDKLKRIFIK
jgi:hypothetical protein